MANNMLADLYKYKRTLELTDAEKTLVRLLLDVAHYVDGESPPEYAEGMVTPPLHVQNMRLELRFTGGWVRDKLLGVESHDIDVAINKMTGWHFGMKLKEYLSLPGVPQRYGLEGLAEDGKIEVGPSGKTKKVGGLHRIEANPEKSKHLETVTTKILGLDVDLVNLRKESYTEISRHPEMEFGTPIEDALRRDATVNAMFFNLRTRRIEDLTGRGLEDMQKKIIRTPLEPHQTFMDDPLRVLRLIRFASRLGYTLDPAAEKAMDNEDIRQSLKIKISRERVGVEVEKMLKGPNPRRALSLIDRISLYDVVFTDPTVDHGFNPHVNGNWAAAFDLLAKLVDPKHGGECASSIRSILLRNPEENYLAWVLTALVPWADAPLPQPSKPGGKTFPVALYVAKEGIKAPNKVADVVTAAVRNLEEIRDLKDRCFLQLNQPHKRAEGVDATARDTVGMAIRRWGASWRSQAIFALLYEIFNSPQAEDATLSSYSAFLKHLEALDVLDAYLFKPLLDGKALAKALSTPPGPWMKEALDVVMAWQLRHPEIRDSSGAIAEVKNKKGELTACLIQHLLRVNIVPLFQNTQHRAITAQGRKSTREELPRRYGSTEDEGSAKPWKFKERWALLALEWVMASMDRVEVEKTWAMLVPTLLNLLDDPDPPIKAKGCEFLAQLFEATPPALLARTGLAEVFEQSLTPCLSYLPTLTPDGESAMLLRAAYKALIALSRARYPKAVPLGDDSESREKAKSIDKLCRQALHSLETHGEYVSVAETLFQQVTACTKELGIESVKHLKSTLILTSRCLSDPFGPAYPPLLLAAIHTLQAVILNAWPRISVHRGEVLKGITSCWVRIMEEDKKFPELETELGNTVLMLYDALGSEFEENEIQILIEADGRLKGLFERG